MVLKVGSLRMGKSEKAGRSVQKRFLHIRD